jgi:hypothetical protein
MNSLSYVFSSNPETARNFQLIKDTKFYVYAAFLFYCSLGPVSIGTLFLTAAWPYMSRKFCLLHLLYSPNILLTLCYNLIFTPKEIFSVEYFYILFIELCAFCKPRRSAKVQDPMNNIQSIKLTPIMNNIPMHKLARVAPISEGEEREGESQPVVINRNPASGDDVYDELECRADKRTGRGELTSYPANGNVYDGVIFDA